MDSPSANAKSKQTELGGSPRHLPDIVLGVVRDGRLLRVDAPEADAIEAGRPAALRPQHGEDGDVDFQLNAVPLLSRIGADRADQVRTDIDAAAAGWPDAALLRLDSAQPGDGRRRQGGAG